METLWKHHGNTMETWFLFGTIVVGFNNGFPARVINFYKRGCR